ncbi:MAG TPA: hypothetical protein VNS32_27615, partial [Flavisolibacter sp.]|nr:hypothetical protein [Flavisolibacter sp.]
CFIVTIIISLFGRPKPEEDLVGLVYSLTPRQKTANRIWYKNPLWLGLLVLLITLLFNVLLF